MELGVQLTWDHDKLRPFVEKYGKKETVRVIMSMWNKEYVEEMVEEAVRTKL